MPFPFITLQYGERQRLRELSKPVEVYDLQLAVGNALNGLLPLQPAKNVFKVGIEEDNASAVDVYENDYDATHTVLTTDVVLIVERISITDLSYVMANTVSNMIYLKKTRKLSTVTNGLTVDILRLFGQHLTDLTLDGPLHDVKLYDILAIFTKLRCLIIENPYHGWVHDLLNADARNIKLLFYGEDNCFENIFSFIPADLLQLLNKNCKISVTCQNPCNETFQTQVERISAYLGPIFTINTTSVSLPFFMVELHYLANPDTPEASSRMLLTQFVSRALLEAQGLGNTSIQS
uniref:Recep_L_domain domain-containing protein n=1 Tax=Panagrellus redivivus TaxID=6233 RepID=A0A7E4W3F4_PANRE